MTGSDAAGRADQKAGLTVKICGANARPKTPAARTIRHRSEPVRRGRSEAPDRSAAVPQSPRFSHRRREPRTPLPHAQPRHHAENDRTMNLPNGPTPHHTNGQASSARRSPPDAAEKPAPPPAADVSPRCVPHDGEPRVGASQTAQENLAAFQRLAEQTADLHRQFLEGQEKTQQTFLKLLDSSSDCRWHSMLPDTAACPAPPTARSRLAIGSHRSETADGLRRRSAHERRTAMSDRRAVRRRSEPARPRSAVRDRRRDGRPS